MSELWIADGVKIDTENRIVVIPVPTRTLPEKEAYQVSPNLSDYVNQIGEGHTVRLPPVRLGGGFGSQEGDCLVISRRDYDAPTRPGVFCESSGKLYKEEADYFQMLISESAEIIRITSSGTLLYPQFEDGDWLARYNDALKEITIHNAQRALKKEISEITPISVAIGSLSNDLEFRFGDFPPIRGRLAFEADTSSLEFAGLLKWPTMPDNVRYLDTEFAGDFYLNREVHRINGLTGEDEVWQGGKRIVISTFKEELAKIDLEKSGGLVVTEKLQEIMEGLRDPNPIILL